MPGNTSSLRRRRLVLLAFAVLAVASLLSAASWHQWRYAEAVAPYPDGKSYDFGTIPEGAMVKHTFRIVNSGSRTLNILRVLPGCGCTDASVSSKKIPPGMKTELSITYHTRPVNHREIIEVMVETDAPDERMIQFSMSGYVRLALSWYPRSVSFYSPSPPDEPLTQDVTLKYAGEAAELKEIKTTSSAITAELLQKGEARAIHITLSPDCPAGGRTEYVTATYRTGSVAKDVNIPVYINVGAQPVRQ